ncbi:hypothetical protein PQR14_34180 [Paraburkholderia bryophila]|uniref:hypothetical protein n=1 Tax=Paraburkholderia bryophila TaxID=420952 RepID=UPI0038B90D0C
MTWFLRVGEAGMPSCVFELLSDLAKTIPGPFFGALFAFQFSGWRARQQKRDEQKAAGNVAMATLCHQWTDFRMFKVAFDLESKRKQPDWAKINPTIFEFSAPQAIDLKPLAFLFERGRVDLLKSLVETTMVYRELVKLVGMNSDAAAERHHKVAALESEEREDFAKIEAAVGEVLVAKLNHFYGFLVRKSENDDALYQRTGKQLYSALTDEFGSAGLMPFDLIVQPGTDRSSEDMKSPG